MGHHDRQSITNSLLSHKLVQIIYLSGTTLLFQGYIVVPTQKINRGFKIKKADLIIPKGGFYFCLKEVILSRRNDLIV